MPVPGHVFSRAGLRYAVVTASLLGCGGGNPALAGDRFDLWLPAPETIVSQESGLLAGASGIAVDGNHRLWIADFLGKRIVSVGFDGADPRVHGREGEGPGELRGPLGLAVGDGVVRVADAASNRLQDYDTAGVHLRDHAPAIPRIGSAAMGLDGRVLVAASPADHALALLHRIAGGVAVPIGEPVVELTGFRSWAAQLDDVRDGEVPAEMRNQVFPAIAAGSLYLVLATEAEVRKYTNDGALLWRTRLDVPEVDAVREDFLRVNAAPDRRAPDVLITLPQGLEVGECFWVLVGGIEGAPTTIYLLDRETGTVEGRLRVQTERRVIRFAVDEALERLYLSAAFDAEILATSVRGVPGRCLRTGAGSSG